MPRLLYLNNRYRTYDRLKYELLSREAELTVLWVNDFPAGETPPSELLSRISYRIFDPDRQQIVRPHHLLRNLRLAATVRRLARGCDLVLSSTSDSWKSKMAALGSWAARRPIAFRKETWRVSPKRLGGTRRLNAWLQNRLTEAIENRAVAILVPGRKVREHLAARGLDEDRALVFRYLHDDLGRLPLDEDLVAELRREKQGLTFLYLGRILPKKGLDVLIRAFRRLRHEKGADACLWVVGEALAADTGRGKVSTAYLEKCRRLAEGEPRIRFHGAAAPDRVHAWYHAADVFVHPHVREVDGDETHEGWGNVITEAACMSKPIVTTDRVASAFDLVREGENGFLLSTHDLENELLRALAFFVADPGAVERFGAQARRAYEEVIDPRINRASLAELFARLEAGGGGSTSRS